MIDNFSYYDKRMSHLEKQCVSIIEESLEMFFAASTKAAYAYTLMISKDLTSFNADTFEKMVFSNRELEAFIESIQVKINREMENYLDYYISADYNYQHSNIECFTALQDTVGRFKNTQKVIKACEKAMKTAFGKAFKSLCPYTAVYYVAKRINIGEKIIGEKSYSKQINRQQEVLLQQIQGMLVNTKISLRNQLIEATIENIHYIQQNKKHLEAYSIA